MNDQLEEQPLSESERNWAMLCHVSSLAGYIIPFGNIIGPVLIWLIKREEFPLVDDQGKESLNFQITVSIAALVCIPLIFVVIGIFLMAILGVVNIVFVVLASIESSKGVPYRYPVCLRLIS